MNTVCHIEFQTMDLDRAEAFYKAVFGWSFQPFMPEMRIFGHGDHHVGGLVLVGRVQAGRSPSVWLRVENLDKTLDRVRSLGGRLLNERMDVPNTGWSDAFEDPDGNTVGIVQYA